MKKTLLIFSMLLVVGSSVMARRLEIPAKVGVSFLKQGTTVKVFYKAATASDVNVRIYDTHGNLKFKETLRKVDGFVRPYNFDGLQKGDYIIEVTDRTGQYVEKVKNSAESNRPQARLIRLQGDERKYLLTISNQKNERLFVKIFDTQGELVYEEPADITSNFSQVYNLERISNKFRVEVTDVEGNSVLLAN